MSGSQKFIARNRAPRVQIEYDVELYGAEKKVQLPFVMGVMSDLSGKSEKPSVEDRKFLEIDVDNFDERMKAVAPRAAFAVPNTLTGEGNIAVDMTFEKMSDFAPEAIAAKTESLAPLLEARKQLANLIAYMDGKSGAEALIERLLANPALMQAVSAGAASPDDTEAALESLRAVELPEEAADTADDTLASLAAAAPEEAEDPDEASDILAAMERIEVSEEEDATDAVLSSMEAMETAEQVDVTDEVLGAIEAVEEPEEAEDTDDILSAIEAVEAPVEAVDTDDVLSAIEALEGTQEADATDDVLGSIGAVEAQEEVDTADDVLSGIEAVETDEEIDATDDVLGAIEAVVVPDEVDNTDSVLGAIDATDEALDKDITDDVLDAIEAVDVAEEADTTDDVLGAIEAADIAEETDTTDDVLGAIEAIDVAPEADVTDDVLSRIEALEEAPAEDATNDVLDAIEALDAPDEAEDTDSVLAAIEDVAEEPDEDQTDDVLAEIEVTEEAAETDNTDDVLGALKAADEADDDDLDDILGALDAPEEGEETDDLDDILGGLEASDDAKDVDDTDDILGGLDGVEIAEDESDLDDILGGLEAEEVEGEADDTDTILSGVEAADVEDEGDDLDDILGGLEAEETAEEGSDADDILAGIEASEELGDADDLDGILGALEAEEDAEASDDLDDILGSLDADSAADEQGDDLDDILTGLESSEPSEADSDDLDDILGGLETSDAAEEASDVDDILGDLDAADAAEEASDDLDSILGSLEAGEGSDAGGDDDLDALLADLGGDDDAAGDGDDLDALLGDLSSEAGNEAPEDDLDALLSDLSGDEDAEDDIDALLGDLGGDEDGVNDGEDLDALLGDLGQEEGGDDLDALLGELDEADAEDATEATPEPAPPKQSPFGKISAPRPTREELARSKFRLALFGDFTGRAAKGLVEPGDGLRNRKPILLDIDTVEDVIARFATTLTLPIGKDGAGVEVPLKKLDDLHPDELYDNLEVFEAIKGLREQLNVGSMAAQTEAQLKEWAAAYGRPIKLPKVSAATNVPADRKLSDFQALIGDTKGTLSEVGPIDNLLAQIVGPHIVKTPDASTEAMKAAVDEALSSALRLVLHHPDFQAVEAQWRSLDLLARRIETDSMLEIVLYDVSAEELAADLAAHEDLAESGFFGLLTDVLGPNNGEAGGFSALFGLYTFEETPPHAELLARIGQVCAHVDAPFFAAMTPSYLETAKEDRHPLVAEAWDTLREMPEAHYVALSSPRFLLRLPYGAKSEPIDPFDFEEFTPQIGLRGMLWANPTVLVMILLAGTFSKDGKAMDLGTLMSLGDLPFHYVTDRHGDQVALPCTERNLTSDAAQLTLGRGFMPVVWVKGRNEIRLGSFCSLAGTTIAGPWQDDVPRPQGKPGDPSGDVMLTANLKANEQPAPQEAVDDDDPLGDFGDGDDDLVDNLGDDDDLLAGLGDDDDDDTSLDDLLAGFGDDDDDDLSDGDDDMDDDLAALLEGL